jgi:hypothetical protein
VNGIFVVVSGNEGDSKLEQVGGELSVSEWQLPPSPTGQLYGAAPLTSSLGSLTSVSVMHYLPTRPETLSGIACGNASSLEISTMYCRKAFFA